MKCRQQKKRRVRGGSNGGDVRINHEEACVLYGLRICRFAFLRGGLSVIEMISHAHTFSQPIRIYGVDCSIYSLFSVVLIVVTVNVEVDCLRKLHAPWIIPHLHVSDLRVED